MRKQHRTASSRNNQMRKSVALMAATGVIDMSNKPVNNITGVNAAQSGVASSKPASTGIIGGEYQRQPYKRSVNGVNRDKQRKTNRRKRQCSKQIEPTVNIGVASNNRKRGHRKNDIKHQLK